MFCRLTSGRGIKNRKWHPWCEIPYEGPVVWFPTRIKFSTQNGVTFDPLPGYFPVLIRIGWSENRLAKST